MNRRIVVGLVLGVLVGGVAAVSAHGQGDMTLLINPEINDFKLIADVDAAYYGSSSVERRKDDFGLGKYSLRLRYPIMRGEDSEAWLMGDVKTLDTSGELRLRRSFQEVPGELYDISAGAAYRKFFTNDWLLAGQVTAGSASDVPFNSLDEVYLKGRAFLQIPHLEHTWWMVLLDVDTNRKLPVVPGVGYLFPVSKQALFMVGVPVIAGGGKIGERFSFDLYYIITLNGRARVAYQVTDSVEVFAGFDWNKDAFRVADRDDDSDSLVYDEKTISTGVNWAVNDSWTVGVKGGYAFDRSLAEGEEDDEWDKTRLDVDDTWFANLQIGCKF